MKQTIDSDCDNFSDDIGLEFEEQENYGEDIIITQKYT